MQPSKPPGLPEGGCCPLSSMQDLSMPAGLMMTTDEGDTGLLLQHARWPDVRCAQTEAENRESQRCCNECGVAAPAVGRPCCALAERLWQSHASGGTLASLHHDPQNAY